MSILNDIKKQLGVPIDYDAFDAELILHINSVLRICNQLGVGVKGFSITGPDEDWDAFLGETTNDLSEVKMYIYLKVRNIWDPPSVGSHVSAIKEQIKELEWRLNVQIDPKDYF